MNRTISVPALLLDSVAVDHSYVPHLVQQHDVFPFLPLTAALAAPPEVVTAEPQPRQDDAVLATAAATATATSTATARLLRYREELRIDLCSALPAVAADIASRDLRAVRRVVIGSGVSYQKIVSVVAPVISAGVDLPLDSVEAPWPLPVLPALKVALTRRDSMAEGSAVWSPALAMATDLDLGRCTVDHGPRISAVAPRLTSLSFDASAVQAAGHPEGKAEHVCCFFRLPAPRPALRELTVSCCPSVRGLISLPLPVDHVAHLRKLHLVPWPVTGAVALIAASARTLEDLAISFRGVQPEPALDPCDGFAVPALPRLRRLSVQSAVPSSLQSVLSAAVPSSLERLQTCTPDHWAFPPHMTTSELVSTWPTFFSRPRADITILRTTAELFKRCVFNNLVELTITDEVVSGRWTDNFAWRCPSLRVLSVTTDCEGIQDVKNLTGLLALRSLTLEVGHSSTSAGGAVDCVFRETMPFPNLEQLTMVTFDDTDYYEDDMGGFSDVHDGNPSSSAVPTAEDFAAMLQRHPRLLEVTLGSPSYGTAQRNWVAAWREVEARAVPPHRPLLLTLR